MKRAFLMLGTMAMAAACARQPPPVVLNIQRPNPDDMASRRVCDVDSLAVERANLVTLVGRLYRTPQPDSVPVGGANGPQGGGGFGPPPRNRSSGGEGRSGSLAVGIGAGVRVGNTSVTAGVGAGVNVDDGPSTRSEVGPGGPGGGPPGGSDGGPPGGGYRVPPRGGDYDGPLPEYSGPQTPNGEVALMNRFNAEIDAQYRAVTSSCRAYTQCMEMNNYDERACADTRAEWSASQERFLQLSVELRKAGRRARGRGWSEGGPAWIGGLEAGYGASERGD